MKKNWSDYQIRNMMRRKYLLVLCCLIACKVVSAQEVGKRSCLSEGAYSFGFRLGLEKRSVENDMLLTIADIEKSEQLKYDLALSGSWFVRDYTALNCKIAYGFSDSENVIEAKILDLVIGAENYSTSTASSSFTAAAGVKNFIPIGSSERFYVFNESNVSYCHYSSLTRDVYNRGDKIHKIHRKGNTVSLALSPGVMYFLTNKLAFEFALNPVILSFSHENTLKDGTIEGSDTDFCLDLKINPFNLYFGFSFFFDNRNK